MKYINIITKHFATTMVNITVRYILIIKQQEPTYFMEHKALKRTTKTMQLKVTRTPLCMSTHIEHYTTCYALARGQRAVTFVSEPRVHAHLTHTI